MAKFAYSILTSSGHVTLEEKVSGHKLAIGDGKRVLFACHKNEVEGVPVREMDWIIDHVPSGFRAGKTRTLVAARALARCLVSTLGKDFWQDHELRDKLEKLPYQTQSELSRIVRFWKDR